MKCDKMNCVKDTNYNKSILSFHSFVSRAAILQDLEERNSKLYRTVAPWTARVCANFVNFHVYHLLLLISKYSCHLLTLLWWRYKLILNVEVRLFSPLLRMTSTRLVPGPGSRSNGPLRKQQTTTDSRRSLTSGRLASSWRRSWRSGGSHIQVSMLWIVSQNIFRYTNKIYK